VLRTQPILKGKAVDPREFPIVVRDDGMPECHSLSGDEQVVATDRTTNLFEASAEPPMGRVGWRFEGQHFKRAQDGLQLRAESWRSIFRGAVP
jgi:hypothetical protein